VRSSRASKRAAGLLALSITIAAATGVSAHRRDEYLQAARLAIDPAAVQLQLDLTPGIALADAVVAAIDANADGSLSDAEQRAYAGQVVAALTLDVDGSPVSIQLDTWRFPDSGSMRRGEGTIQLESSASLPRLPSGSHQLRFRNRHNPARSVYLANALVPRSYQVAVTAQQRDTVQSELTIDYILRAGPRKSRVVLLLGAIAVAMVLSALRLRRGRGK